MAELVDLLQKVIASKFRWTDALNTNSGSNFTGHIGRLQVDGFWAYYIDLGDRTISGVACKWNPIQSSRRVFDEMGGHH